MGKQALVVVVVWDSVAAATTEIWPCLPPQKGVLEETEIFKFGGGKAE